MSLSDLDREELARQYLEEMGLDEYEIDEFLYKHSNSDHKIVSDIISRKRSILVYDIETTLLKNWTFRCGNQYIQHSSLDKAFNTYDIICITYCYNDGKASKAIHWGHGPETSESMTTKFDETIKKAQDSNTIIIGKNNKRFDDKHINTHRWINGQKPMPDWIKYTEDLEAQLRKYFYLPSYSLDYVSQLRGLGGKKKMELQDWINIVNYKMLNRLLAINPSVRNDECMLLFGYTFEYIMKEGKIALNKMLEYGKKDATDTMSLILDVSDHCEFKSNVTQYKGVLRCRDPFCGSYDITKNGRRKISGNRYQTFYCNKHGGYAGRALIRQNGSLGKML